MLEFQKKETKSQGNTKPNALKNRMNQSLFRHEKPHVHVGKICLAGKKTSGCNSFWGFRVSPFVDYRWLSGTLAFGRYISGVASMPGDPIRNAWHGLDTISLDIYIGLYM